MAKSRVGEVWGMHGGKLHRFTGVKIGESMLTFPTGRRQAKDGRGTGGYYATEREAAEAMIEQARWSLNYHRSRVRSYESMVADCERVIAEPTTGAAPAATPTDGGDG